MAFPTSGILAYWKLDESSGNASDSSGNGHTLTNVGSMAYAAALINNGANNATTGKYVAATDTGMAITGTTTITMNAWIKGGAIAGGAVFGRRGGAPDHINYGIDFGTGLRFSFTSAAATYQQWMTTSSLASLGLTNGAWHMVTIVYTFGTGSSIVCYVDGSSVGGSWVTGNGNATHTNDVTEETGIGNYGGTASQATGLIDEVGIWTVGLTSGNVTTLYNGGAGLSFPVGTSYTITCTNGSFTLTGFAATFKRFYGTILAKGQFNLTGFAAMFAKGKGFTASTGYFVLTGFAATFTDRIKGWIKKTRNTSSWVDKTRD